MSGEAEDARRFAPATQRNREPILGVLRDVLPETGLVLEVASGTGEHAVHFARALPQLTWQSSDPSPDALVCINRVHISPWAATEGLMRGAGHLLPKGAPLVLYGPFRRAGAALEPSNAAFDADLRMRNPEWGLRLLEAVAACASAQGLVLEQVVAMPANNLTVVFRKA